MIFHLVGVDYRPVHGKQSHNYVLVILFTKLTALSVGSTMSAENLVVAIRKYWTTYGETDMPLVISDWDIDLNFTS